jgi:hypothetical protein
MKFPVRCEQPTMDERAAGVHARQIVMEFDMATWKVMPLLTIFCAVTRLIPARYAARHRNLGHHRIPDTPASSGQDQDW